VRTKSITKQNTTNMKKDTSKWFRIFLGIFLIVYALNQFLHFLPTSYGDMPEEARDFLDSIIMYLPMLYVFEIITGLFLVFNKWSAFVQIVIFPLSVAFLIFTFANKDVSETWPALVVAGINVALLVNDREKYKVLFD
jgi:putative oxidoreductase